MNKALDGYRLALAAVVLAAVVVVLGAFTRLADAGLGCPDWPGCYGQLIWPNTPDEVARAEAAFPHAPVDHEKTWPEMVHRYCASLLGLMIVILAIIAVRHRMERGYPFRLPLFLLLLVVWQGLFGMWTVTLKLWPQVVTAHLLGGFTVLSLLWVLLLRLRNRHWRLSEDAFVGLARFRPWVIGGMALVLLQVLLGGWTSSNYAAIACPDFPTCQGSWLPPMDFSQGFNLGQHMGPNYLGGLMENDARVAIHYTHRIGAVLVTLYLTGLCTALLVSNIRKVRLLTLMVLAALFIQLVLGISNVLFYIPLPVAVAHNAGGALLLLMLVTLATRMYSAVCENPGDK